MAPSFVIGHTLRIIFFYVCICFSHSHYLKASPPQWFKCRCNDNMRKEVVLWSPLQNLNHQYFINLLFFYLFFSTTMVIVPLSLNDLASWAMWTFLFFFVHFVNEQKAMWMCMCASVLQFFCLLYWFVSNEKIGEVSVLFVVLALAIVPDSKCQERH